MGFWSSMGSSAASGAGSGAVSSILGGIDEVIGLNDLKRSGELDYQSALMSKQWDYAQQAAALEYQYGLRSLRESPSAAREGLEKAGYNPILAINSGAGASAGHVNVGDARGGGNSGGTSSKPVSSNATANATNDILESEADTARSEAKVASYGVPAARAESAAKQAEAEQRQLLADAFVEAVTGEVNLSHRGPNSKGYDDLVERFRNKAERDRYLDSVEHQVYEDIREGVSSAADATRAGAAVKSAIKTRPEITEKHVYHHNRK